MEGRLLVGDVEITCFTDANGDASKGRELFPEVQADQWLPYRRDFPEAFLDPESWNGHFGCYVIRERNRTLLVDTGIGPNPDPDFFPGLRLYGRLLHALAAGGIHPGDIDTVILTHLHPDHVGWNLTAEGLPAFPNARYVVHRADWDAFQSAEGQQSIPFPYVDLTITPLEALGVLQLVSEATNLTDAVSIHPAPGHTPGHICVLISDGGQKAMILGDVIVHPAQVTEPEWRFICDMAPETAVATRKRLLGRLELESITAIQCHCPPPGFRLVVRTAGRRRWQPLEPPPQF